MGQTEKSSLISCQISFSVKNMHLRGSHGTIPTVNQVPQLTEVPFLSYPSSIRFLLF